MRGRRFIWISVVTILLASATLIDVGIASPAIRMYVDPASVSLPPYSSFDLNIYIQDVTPSMGNWQFTLRWDPEILYSDKGRVTEGPFLSSAGTTMFVTTELPDRLIVGCMLTEYVIVSGSGLLATVSFDVIGEGSSPLDLLETIAQDIDGNDLSYTVDDGSFTNAVPVSANLVKRSAWPEHHHFKILGDEDHIQSLWAKAKNLGSNPAYIRVEFTIVPESGEDITLEAKYMVGGVETQVEPGKEVTISVDCWISLETAWDPNKYSVNATAKCSYYGLAWTYGTKSKTTRFTIVP